MTECYSTSTIYEAYRTWCYMHEVTPKSAKEFRDGLALKMQFPFAELTRHTDKGTYYRNLMLTPAATQELL